MLCGGGMCRLYYLCSNNVIRCARRVGFMIDFFNHLLVDGVPPAALCTRGTGRMRIKYAMLAVNNIKRGCRRNSHPATVAHAPCKHDKLTFKLDQKCINPHTRTRTPTHTHCTLTNTFRVRQQRMRSNECTSSGARKWNAIIAVHPLVSIMSSENHRSAHRNCN